MKKSIFIISFIILSLFFSCSFVFAENAGEQVVNGIRDTVGGVENAAEDATNNAGGAIKNGANAVKDTTENAANDVKNTAENMGDDVKESGENMGNNIQNTMNDNTDENNQGNDSYTATRTAAENSANTSNSGWMNRDMWTWIVVGIITIVIIALIWYYVSRNNH